MTATANDRPSGSSDDLVGNQAAADYCGVGIDSWRPYVARDQAPKPYRREIRGGYAQPVWRKTDLDAWLESRPGKGRRRLEPAAPPPLPCHCLNDQAGPCYCLEFPPDSANSDPLGEAETDTPAA